MKVKVDKTLVASVALHVLVIGWGLVSFSTKAFDTMPQESLPVDIISADQLAKVTAGMKTGWFVEATMAASRPKVTAGKRRARLRTMRLQRCALLRSRPMQRARHVTWLPAATGRRLTRPPVQANTHLGQVNGSAVSEVRRGGVSNEWAARCDDRAPRSTRSAAARGRDKQPRGCSWRCRDRARTAPGSYGRGRSE